MVLCHRIHRLLPANLHMLIIPRYWQGGNDSVKMDSLPMLYDKVLYINIPLAIDLCDL